MAILTNTYFFGFLLPEGEAVRKDSVESFCDKHGLDYCASESAFVIGKELDYPLLGDENTPTTFVYLTALKEISIEERIRVSVLKKDIEQAFDVSLETPKHLIVHSLS